MLRDNQDGIGIPPESLWTRTRVSVKVQLHHGKAQRSSDNCRSACWGRVQVSRQRWDRYWGAQRRSWLECCRIGRNSQLLAECVAERSWDWEAHLQGGRGSAQAFDWYPDCDQRWLVISTWIPFQTQWLLWQFGAHQDLSRQMRTGRALSVLVRWSRDLQGDWLWNQVERGQESHTQDRRPTTVIIEVLQHANIFQLFQSANYAARRLRGERANRGN